MTATVVVHAEPPLTGLVRGSFGVVIDGVRAGRVRQGALARFPVPPGTHTVRVTTWDPSRSNTVTVEVAEGREVLVAGRGTGLGFALLVPPLAVVAVDWSYVIAALLVMLAVFAAVPGLLFRLRAVGDSALPEADPADPADPAAPAGPADGEQGGGALWWESDPALAKRFRKDA
ncbi:hypothetical protein AB0O91_16990 [Kitasatospora sp. NPDC089797]|uniref:hypothetical protein n=1 Tax=Kitasatospora sp. NPDC089797 TaxID=3155298 RepID=UPI0034280C57